MPALVAQLDARSLGDEVTVDSCEVDNILSWRFDHEIFSTVILSSTDSRRAGVSFWRKNVHNTG